MYITLEFTLHCPITMKLKPLPKTVQHANRTHFYHKKNIRSGTFQKEQIQNK